MGIVGRLRQWSGCRATTAQFRSPPRSSPSAASNSGANDAGVVKNPKSSPDPDPKGLTPMLKCSTSLWSADLANLASEIKRVEPYSERFHLDVADGHYVGNLLFFPDLVRALRRHTPASVRGPFDDHGPTGVDQALLGCPADNGKDVKLAVTFDTPRSGFISRIHSWSERPINPGFRLRGRSGS